MYDDLIGKKVDLVIYRDDQNISYNLEGVGILKTVSIGENITTVICDTGVTRFPNNKIFSITLK